MKLAGIDGSLDEEVLSLGQLPAQLGGLDRESQDQAAVSSLMPSSPLSKRR